MGSLGWVSTPLFSTGSSVLQNWCLGIFGCVFQPKGFAGGCLRFSYPFSGGIITCRSAQSAHPSNMFFFLLVLFCVELSCPQQLGDCLSVGTGHRPYCVLLLKVALYHFNILPLWFVQVHRMRMKRLTDLELESMLLLLPLAVSLCNLILPYMYHALRLWERLDSPILEVYIAICR